MSLTLSTVTVSSHHPSSRGFDVMVDGKNAALIAQLAAEDPFCPTVPDEAFSAWSEDAVHQFFESDGRMRPACSSPQRPEPVCPPPIHLEQVDPVSFHRVSPPHTGRERMGSPTMQTPQDPILLLPWLCFPGCFQP